MEKKNITKNLKIKNKVLVVGSGGREHALSWKLRQSEHVKELYCAPGNGGTCIDAKNVAIEVDDFEGIKDFVIKNKIKLTVVGPEVPLVNGIVDSFYDEGLVKKGHLIFGPIRKAAKLEGSKASAKLFMKKYGIPTADFEIFDNFDDANKYIKKKEFPLVVKASGLAAGKGSIVCKTLEQAVNALDRIMIKKEFKDSGKEVVIEEFMEGEEASILALTDGKIILPLVSSQDHKPIFETQKDRERWLKTGGDNKYKNYEIGPNTGGMGAYAPAPIVTDKVMKKVCKKILEPTITHMAEEGNKFVGCLYAGLMIKDNEPRVLEFNVRFGDPEAQPVLSLLKNDLYELLMACIKGNLNDYEIKNKKGAACCVVMASGGYPGEYEKGKEISGLDAIKNMPNVYVFHAGTKIENGKTLTNGGRVLGVTGTGNSIKEARKTTYSIVDKISFGNEHHRTDIGAKALKR